MPGKIFVSYRREDAAAEAARIRDRLTAAFGSKHVFMDVDELKPGQRFDEELAKALSTCDAFLAVIGPRWYDIAYARAQAGAHDYVRETSRYLGSREHRTIMFVAQKVRTPQQRETSITLPKPCL
jgi:hypothetical protein